MNELSAEELKQQIKKLEKQNRLLQKKLERSESNRVELENSYEIQSKLVNQVVQGLEQSRADAEARSQDLEKALNDLKAMQSKLIEAEKMSALGILIAGIAHEINNPINFIYGNINHAIEYAKDILSLLELYQDVYPEPNYRIKELRESLELDFIFHDFFKLLNSMKVGSDRIREIVLGLRIFSRLDEAEYKMVNLHDGLDSTLMLLKHRLKADDSRPQIDLIKNYGELPKIACFSGEINQVFMNVLVNAIDAVEEKYVPNQHQHHDQNQYQGHIKVATSIVASTWVKIVISDNGIGMTEEVRRKIFNPFFTTKITGKGTGMGMSISYQVIVEKHGGKLDCCSQLGQGTTFSIQIPIREASK